MHVEGPKIYQMNRHIDSFQNMWNEKQGPKSHLKYGGVPSVWGGEGRGDSEEKLFGEAQQENMT